VSIFADIATEHTVSNICKAIAKELNGADEQSSRHLKAVGRVALDQFDFTFPEWAKEYKKLFSE